jgi:hypothetical protein
MIAYKFKIQNKINIDDYIRQFNNVIRFSYNRFQENSKLSLSQVEKIVKQKMNNIDLIDSSLIKVAVNKSKGKHNKKNIIFGGKGNFIKRIKNLISKEDWKSLKNSPIELRGSKADNKGNRKAELNIIEDNYILIKFNKKTHFKIQLPKLTILDCTLRVRMAILNCFNLFTVDISILKRHRDFQNGSDRCSAISMNISDRAPFLTACVNFP